MMNECGLIGPTSFYPSSILLTLLLLVVKLQATEPPFIPPAREVTWLNPTNDGLGFNLVVNVGTPPQPVPLLFDTGSSVAFVFAKSLCHGEEQFGVSTTCYDYTLSTSLTPSDPLTAPTLVYSLELDNDVCESSPARVLSDNFSMPTFRWRQPGTERASTLVTASLVHATQFSITPPRSGVMALHTFKHSAGVIGASYSSLSSSVSSAFLFMMDKFPYDPQDQSLEQPIFSLDLPYPVNAGDPLQRGKLFIGGITEEARPHLQWSLPRQARHYHEFTMYDLSVCGTPLNKVSYSYSAVVDSGAACLGVVEELFDMLVAWVPVECNSPGDVCSLPQGVRPILPTLSFAVSADGPKLHLPLHTLLVKYSQLGIAGADGYRYCMVRRKSFEQLTAAGEPHVIFGTRPLLAFHFAASMKTNQMALGNKQAFSESTVQCRLAQVCVGMQTRDPATNTCSEPKCSDYYFFSLDKGSHQCVLSVAFHVLTVLFVTLILGAELYLYAFEAKVVRKVMEQVDAT